MIYNLLARILVNRIITLKSSQFVLVYNNLLIKNIFNSHSIPVDKIKFIKIYDYSSKQGLVVYVHTDSAKFNTDFIYPIGFDQLRKTLKEVFSLNDQIKLDTEIEEFINTGNTMHLPKYFGNIFNFKFLAYVILGIALIFAILAIEHFLSKNLPEPVNSLFKN